MDDVFDIIVLGTGLSESIAAAALAKTGLKVAHIDPNPYYGAAEATLTLDELIQWAEARSTNSPEDSEVVRYRIDHLSSNRLPQEKQYSISLSPSVIPSVGPFISSLVSSGVARYGSYKLLGPAAIYRSGGLYSVPQNKETVFQDKAIPLIEKRRLMRFLVFASGDFEHSPELQGKEDLPFDRFLCECFGLSAEISRTIMFALAYCNFSADGTLNALHRVRSSLRSVGRYGSSPFLVGYYGGSGEIVQGFCRASAVNGGVYILGRKISSITVHDVHESERFSVHLEDIPEALRSSCILSSMTCVPRDLRSQLNFSPSGSGEPVSPHGRVRSVARCIAIVDGTIMRPGPDDDSPIEGQSDSLLIVFPPGSLDHGSQVSCVTLLTAGPGTMSSPSEKNVLYLSMSLEDDEKSSKELLQPYLDKVLELNPTCQLMFELFYLQYLPTVFDELVKDSTSTFFILPYLQPDVFRIFDQAAHDAENCFWSVVLLGLQKDLDREQDIWVNHFLDVDDQ